MFTRPQAARLAAAFQSLLDTMRKHAPPETWEENEIEREAQEAVDALQEYAESEVEPWETPNPPA